MTPQSGRLIEETFQPAINATTAARNRSRIPDGEISNKHPPNAVDRSFHQFPNQSSVPSSADRVPFPRGAGRRVPNPANQRVVFGATGSHQVRRASKAAGRAGVCVAQKNETLTRSFSGREPPQRKRLCWQRAPGGAGERKSEEREGKSRCTCARMSERVKANAGNRGEQRQRQAGAGCVTVRRNGGWRRRAGEGRRPGGKNGRSAKKTGEGANHAPANPFSGAARVHLIASLSN